ncbi:MAG: hypothetical protein H7A21_13825 [Spirochaetales bacterium]|nr:hypothetical protein [Spirochaetales bacterium]
MTAERDIGEYLDLLSYVILCAPDDFPHDDFRAADEQMSLDRAFARLRDGLAGLVSYAPEMVMTDLKTTLDAAFDEYRGSNDVKGAHLLQDLEEKLKKTIA